MTSFDAYLTVDWSAGRHPVTGKDSIWFCLLTRDKETRSYAVENPATRKYACDRITQLLRKLATAGKRVLVGFDFPYGYPAGFATALGLERQPAWLEVWHEIASRIEDADDNNNNRFKVAAEFNHRISGRTNPFWGCRDGCKCARLSHRKDDEPGQLPENRLTDVAGMQPVWKLWGAGSVGSQTLMGIPRLLALRTDPVLAPISVVWPFETGLRFVSGQRRPAWQIVHAEIYPSIISEHSAPGHVKDEKQVRSLADHFASQDDEGRLDHLFAGPAGVTDEEINRIEREEGWTLGVDTRSQPRRTRHPKPSGQRMLAEPVREPKTVARPTRKSTQAAYENRNGQIVLRGTGLAGTDHGQYIYVLQCSHCGHQYGANGSDIFQRRCPACQHGKPGLRY